MPSENKRHQKTEKERKRGEPVTDTPDESTDAAQIFAVCCDNADPENGLSNRLLPICREIREVVQYHKKKGE
jgi:hypothetical protein